MCNRSFRVCGKSEKKRNPPRERGKILLPLPPPREKKFKCEKNYQWVEGPEGRMFSVNQPCKNAHVKNPEGGGGGLLSFLVFIF
jgi:hypothetical protein